MTAVSPTIIATSIGFEGSDVAWHPGPAYGEALRLARPGSRGRLCIISTAIGDMSRQPDGRVRETRLEARILPGV